MLTRNYQAEGWTNFPCTFVPWSGMDSADAELDRKLARSAAQDCRQGAGNVSREFQPRIDFASGHQTQARIALRQAAAQRGWDAAINEYTAVLPADGLQPVPTGIGCELRGVAYRSFRVVWSDGVISDISL